MSSLAAIPHCDFSPRQDALDIYKAFKGLGCDESVVISILAHRDFTQRALIEEEYKAMYAEDLAKRLKSELSGNLEAWMKLQDKAINKTCSVKWHGTCKYYWDRFS